MNDNTTRTIHDALRVSSQMAPPAPDLPMYRERPIVRRPVAALAGGFAAVILIVGLGLALVAQGNKPTIAEDTAANPSTRADTEVPLLFDTGALGVQLHIDDGPTTIDLDLASLVKNVQADIDADYELSGAPVFVGRVGETEGFVAVFSKAGDPDLTCQIRATKPAGNSMACGQPDDSNMGILLNHPEDTASATAVISTTDPDIEVIAVRLATGEEYWQRTINGGALLEIPHNVPRQADLTFTAYSANGDVLGVQGP